MSPRNWDRNGEGDALPVEARAGLLSIFWTFFFISAITLGGGLSMVPVMAAEFRKRSWMEERPFYALFARAQAFPGPIAFTMSWSLGRELRGAPGALLSALGVIIPPFFAVIVVAWAVNALGSPPWLAPFFSGVYATVPGLAAALAYRMLKKGSWRAPAVVFSVILAAAMIAFRSWSVPIFFSGAAAWYFLGRLWKS